MNKKVNPLIRVHSVISFNLIEINEILYLRWIVENIQNV